MRKLFLLSLVVVMTMMFSIGANADDLMFGDVTVNASIDAEDALAVLKHAAKIETLSDELLTVADVTADGNIDAADALDILKYAAKIIDSFAAESPAPTEEATVEPTDIPQITPLPTSPVIDIPVGTYPTQIPLPVVEAKPENYVEGVAAELVALNGATEENGIYTFTDDNKTNRKGISFVNPFAGRTDLVEKNSEALFGQSTSIPSGAKLKYDPTVTYPSPVWKKGVSISFWAKYDWDSEHYSDDDPIMVIHRSKRDSKDFTVSLLLDGTVRFEEGEDASNSFRGNGAVCGNYNEWNYYTITMANDWICVYVNGQECVYQNYSFTKGAIGLFNGGYMTRYNVPWVMSDDLLANDIRGYYKRQLSGEGNVVELEASRIDNGVFDSVGCWSGGTLLMNCLTNEDTELVIGGCTTFKVNGSMGKSEYSLESGTQVADVEAYYVELTAEQVAANYAAAAEEFLK